jgi:regulator of protease activity HflC (stomatin/prohibitin superfamily)
MVDSSAMSGRRDGLTAQSKRRSPDIVEWVRTVIGRYLFATVLSSLVLVTAIVLLSPFIFIEIPAGHVGVVYRPWSGGTVTTTALSEGNNFVFPWNSVTTYDTRIQLATEKFEAITKDDLHIQVQIKYRYRTRAETLGRLQRLVGPNYKIKLLDPAVSSSLRQEISKYSAVDVYGGNRSGIQKAVFDDVVSPLNKNFVRAAVTETVGSNVADKVRGRISQVDPNGDLVELMDVLITDVTLPKSVRDAIERKEQAEQLTEEYKYRIQKEELESQRKEIEGRGIAAFQREVQASMSPSYLKWRGIEATLDLAKSDNAKVVIVGGADGLPLIFNADETAKSTLKKAKAATK